MNETTFECGTCSFKLWLPIKNLEVSTLGLYDDSRYPGRCLLVFNEHIENFEELDINLAACFIKDIQKAAKAIKRAIMADKINYAILGNAEPHLHVHLIPRKKEGDPIPNRSPWNHPEPCSKLPLNKRDFIIKEIAYALLKY